MKNNGMLVVLSGPAGSGKDTVISELFKSDFDITKSVSMTTRKPRDGETDGIDYIRKQKSVKVAKTLCINLDRFLFLNIIYAVG